MTFENVMKWFALGLPLYALVAVIFTILTLAGEGLDQIAMERKKTKIYTTIAFFFIACMFVAMAWMFFN